LAKGVLHNLGNAMTPIGVRLAILRTRLNSIPTEDLTLAARELACSNTDAGRRADLEEFVRLTCVQLASSIASAGQDVEIMTRQSALVQTALTEQIRSNGNEHVMESVRLADLLAHSLDVVPDWARQRLEIHADPSLDALGVLQVPRTVLHLVLQNFVINAAEAVREAGRSKGSLFVKAEVLTRNDTRQLVVCCIDDGVGIASHNLQRIFEKGFSTKSRETNFGIGLHWCANAMGALGGRVWATSAGQGHGATLHVMIPLSAARGSILTRAA
jgi:signal transduction histidine kinase